MIITSIRYGRLKSLPGFDNVRLEKEAIVLDGDDPEEIERALVENVHQGLERLAGERKLARNVDFLTDLVVTLEKQRDRLKNEIETNRKIIAEHEQLGELAKEKGLDPHGLDDDGIPF